MHRPANVDDRATLNAGRRRNRSGSAMRANQLRLWFASTAYVLIHALRRIGLADTQFARAACSTIRLRLLKIVALVRTSVRRTKLAMPAAFPYQAEYRAARAALTRRNGLTNQRRQRNTPHNPPLNHYAR